MNEADRSPGALVASIFQDAAALHARLADGEPGPVVAAARALVAAFRAGRKVLVFGNGGSAAEAQHFAAELVGRFERERAGWPVVALTTDTSALTALGNDYGFDAVFARQVDALGASGDVAFGITTSGRSANVVAALDAAHRRGLVTVALTGRDGGPAGAMADVHINVPHESTARVQEAQLTLLHILCALVEREMAS